MRGQAAIFPIAFAIVFGVVNGVAIFKPLIVEERLKKLREKKGIVDHEEGGPPPNDKEFPVRLEVEANAKRGRQPKEAEATGTLNLVPKAQGSATDSRANEVVQPSARWYQFWR